MGTFDTVDNPQPYAWAMYVSKSVPLYRISKDWLRYSKEAREVHKILVFFLCGSSKNVDMTVVGMEKT